MGANLARRLLDDGHDVHLILRRAHNPWRVEEISEHVAIHDADVADADSVAAAFAAALPDWVFHLAAYGAYPEQKDAPRMVTTNVMGTLNMLTAAQGRGFEAFVNAGTSSEYGYKDHAPAEDEPLEPNSMYAVTKAAATQMCRMTARSHDLPVRTMRIYSAYGPYEEPTRLVPTLAVRGLAGELPPLANPDIARDYVYVDDVCEAFVLAAATPNQEPGVVYNVGTGVQTKLRDIVEVSRRLLAIEAEPRWGSMEQRSWDTSTWVSNPVRLEQRLGWRARRGLEAGLRETVEWFRVHPALLQHYRTQIDKRGE